jgi:hypothetical protein
VIKEDGLAPEPQYNTPKNLFGSGRSVYIPRIIPSLEIPPAETIYSIPPKYLALPANFKELIRAVEWASKDTIPLKAEAPLTVTLELLCQKKEDRIILHLLNYDLNVCAENVGVELRIPSGKRVKTMQRLDIDAAGIRKMEFRETGDGISFKLDKLRIYSMIVMEMEVKGVK